MYMRTFDDEEIKALCTPNNIIGQLINGDVDPEWLSSVPHRKFVDMYIVYRLNVGSLFSEEKGIYSVIIDNNLMHETGWVESSLYAAAIYNIGEPYIANTVEFLGLDSETTHDPLSDIFLVITSNEHIYGAFVIADIKVLNTVAKRINGDFIILPGSVDEMYACKLLPDLDMSEIQSLAKEVSSMVDSKKDFITDKIYIYRGNVHAIETVPGGITWQL